MVKNEIPKQYESLFGQPPLLEGEDREAYLALRSAVIEDRNTQPPLSSSSTRTVLRKDTSTPIRSPASLREQSSSPRMATVGLDCKKKSMLIRC
jgi:hypothetical protein